MPDNVGITPGSGAIAAADDIGGALYQRIKLIHGDDGINAGDVSSNNPMPVIAYGELVEAIEALRMAVQSLNRSAGLLTVDTSARMRVAVEALSAAVTLATVTTVTTVGTVTNQAQMGGFAGNEQIPALMKMQADNLRRNISVT